MECENRLDLILRGEAPLRSSKMQPKRDGELLL